MSANSCYFNWTDDKIKDNESDKKDKKDDGKEGGARNLWVSGLSGDTRAKDLKQLCSKHGKVIKNNISTHTIKIYKSITTKGVLIIKISLKPYLNYNNNILQQIE